MVNDNFTDHKLIKDLSFTFANKNGPTIEDCFFDKILMIYVFK